MHSIKVEQEEMIVIPAETGFLWTEGVSTCICLVLLGEVAARKFIAMYHWEGCSTTFDKNASKDLKNVIFNIFRKFRRTILETMTSRDKPELHFFYQIGGEKATSDLSGTELEVQGLRQYAVPASKKYFKVSESGFFGGRNFLTHGSQSLRVKFSLNLLSCEDDEKTDPELDDSESNTDSNRQNLEIH